MMGGGLSEGAAHATTKAMDVSGQDGRCEEIYDLPHQVFAPMGARTGGRPVVRTKTIIRSFKVSHRRA